MKTIFIALVACCAALPAQEAPKPPTAPTPPAERGLRTQIHPRIVYEHRGNYRRGTQALDEKKYDEAIREFDAVVARKDPRADGALYWKAYTLNRLGKKTDALGALDQLARDYAQSAWLNDAKALRIEVQQSSGQPVSPESQGDEDLKLLAINGLMHSEPERAMPLLQKVLADPKAAPKVRERALFVLARSQSPKSQEALLAIARGGGNPDLQARAIEFLGVNGNKSELAQLYGNANSAQAKEAIQNALVMARDSDKLAELAKSEPDAKLRASAIQRLGMLHSDKTAPLLSSLYASETDPQIKRSILDSLFMQRDGKMLVDLARKESDPALKKAMVERLSMMKSKEATEYMLELLSK